MLKVIAIVVDEVPDDGVNVTVCPIKPVFRGRLYVEDRPTVKLGGVHFPNLILSAMLATVDSSKDQRIRVKGMTVELTRIGQLKDALADLSGRPVNLIQEGEGGQGEGDDDGAGQDGADDGDAEGDGDGQGEEEGEGKEKKNGKGGKGVPEDGVLDDHSGWGDCPPAAQEIAKERLKEAVRKAAEEATKAGSWGDIGSDCRRDITDRLITTKVDWKNVLRYFIKTSQVANRKSTIKRINKRYPYIHPGRKKTRTAKIAISVDQSGSVDDGMLQAFFAELNKLAEYAEFTVIPFDTDVAESKVFVWKKGEKKKWERVACGGTCFNAPTKYVNEGQFDGHIVLTDMCAPLPML